MILTRLVIQFRRGFKRNEKPICLSSTRFIAHLVNQQVVSTIYYNHSQPVMMFIQIKSTFPLTLNLL